MLKNDKTDSPMIRSILNMPQFSADEIKGLVRTFPLYVKMSESYFPQIKTAECQDEVGDEALKKLRDIYYKK